MDTLASQPELTPADLHARPDGASFELVCGKLIARQVCDLSSRTECLLGQKLAAFVAEASAGRVWTGSEIGYRCFADQPNTVRRPDIAYLHENRYSQDHIRDGFLLIRPDLVVEVVSAWMLAWEVDSLVEEYLAVNVPLVWVINPFSKLAIVHRKDGSISKLMAADALSGEDILPGFHCRLADFIPRR